MSHQYYYLLRDLYNQKGGFHAENIHLDILLHETYLTFFFLILFHSPLPNGLSWFLFYFASLTFSILFSSSQALNVDSPTKPNSWPFVLFYTSS